MPALAIASVATACANAGPEIRTGACDVFGPIYLDSADVDLVSDGLVDQVLTHNETGAALCGWRPIAPGDPSD